MSAGPPTPPDGSILNISIGSLLDWMNIIYLAALTITVVASVALWRLSVLSNAAKDRQLAAYKTTADLQIAQAQTAAGVATESAARANERAEQARLDAERLRASVVWRVLDDQQCAVMADVLRGQPGSVLIEYPFGDPEALLYAISLKNCFGRLAGWTVGSAALAFKDVLPIEIALNGRNKSAIEVVQRAFSAIGASYRTDDGSSDAGVIQRIGSASGWGDVKIIVGSRPLFP